MQEFDVVLKLLLQHSKQILPQLAGITVVSWLPTELPRVQNRRLDLLGQASDGTLVQLECQSTNDPAMPLRMAEYSLAVYRLHGRFPLQLVLYIGREPARMADRLQGPFGSFQYTLVDLREVDSAPLLASAEPSDNVLGILTRLAEPQRAVAHLVRRVAEEREPEQRTFYLEALLLLAGLRGLEKQVEEEAKRVPVLYDILENKVLGREYLRGRQEGLQEGLQEGRQEGRQEGERMLLRRQMEKRFGPVPEWASQRLAQLSEHDLGELSLRLFEAQTLEELLR
jgi:predicted transposase YdaD